MVETLEQIQPGLQQGQHGAVLGDPGADPHHHLTHTLLCLHQERRNFTTSFYQRHMSHVLICPISQIIAMFPNFSDTDVNLRCLAAKVSESFMELLE